MLSLATLSSCDKHRDFGEECVVKSILVSDSLSTIKVHYLDSRDHVESWIKVDSQTVRGLQLGDTIYVESRFYGLGNSRYEIYKFVKYEQAQEVEHDIVVQKPQAVPAKKIRLQDTVKVVSSFSDDFELRSGTETATQ